MLVDITERAALANLKKRCQILMILRIGKGYSGGALKTYTSSSSKLYDFFPVGESRLLLIIKSYHPVDL